MKTISFVAILLLSASSCTKKTELVILPAQLIGTWSTVANQQPYQRWTFDQRYVYMTPDSTTGCQAVNNVSFSEYFIENSRLTLRYAGITNGLFPIPDVRFRIESITNTHLELRADNEQLLIFEKCP